MAFRAGRLDHTPQPQSQPQYHPQPQPQLQSHPHSHPPIPAKAFAEAAEAALSQEDVSVDEDAIKESPPKSFHIRNTSEPRPFGEVIDEPSPGSPSLRHPKGRLENSNTSRQSDHKVEKEPASTTHDSSKIVNNLPPKLGDLKEAGKPVSQNGTDDSESYAEVVRDHPPAADSAVINGGAAVNSHSNGVEHAEEHVKPEGNTTSATSVESHADKVKDHPPATDSVVTPVDNIGVTHTEDAKPNDETNDTTDAETYAEVVKDHPPAANSAVIDGNALVDSTGAEHAKADAKPNDNSNDATGVEGNAETIEDHTPTTDSAAIDSNTPVDSIEVEHAKADVKPHDDSNHATGDESNAEDMKEDPPTLDSVVVDSNPQVDSTSVEHTKTDVEPTDNSKEATEAESGAQTIEDHPLATDSAVTDGNAQADGSNVEHAEESAKPNDTTDAETYAEVVKDHPPAVDSAVIDGTALKAVIESNGVEHVEDDVKTAKVPNDGTDGEGSLPDTPADKSVSSPTSNGSAIEPTSSESPPAEPTTDDSTLQSATPASSEQAPEKLPTEEANPLEPEIEQNSGNSDAQNPPAEQGHGNEAEISEASGRSAEQPAAMDKSKDKTSQSLTEDLTEEMTIPQLPAASVSKPKDGDFVDETSTNLLPGTLVYENIWNKSGENLASLAPAHSDELSLQQHADKKMPSKRPKGAKDRTAPDLVSGRQAGEGWSTSAVRWAPLNVPLQRRLQMAAVLMYTVLMASLAALFFILCTIPILWPILIPYLVYVLLSKAAVDGKLKYRSHAFRSSRIWSAFGSYFPARIHRSQELEPTRKYIFGYHPHGIISHGAFVGFGSEALGFSQLFPGITNTLLTLDSNFRIPLYRDFLLRMGLASVSRESCENLLSKGGPNGEGMGRAITIVIGGARESLDATPFYLRLVLKRRKGFVKLAIRTGADLVPVLSFGENDLYDQLSAEEHPTVHKFQMLTKKFMGFTVPLFHARGVFNYDVGIMPYRRPINIVVGKPIRILQSKTPDPAYVDEIHEQYVNELLRVWDDWKDVFAPDRKGELEIVE